MPNRHMKNAQHHLNWENANQNHSDITSHLAIIKKTKNKSSDENVDKREF